MNDYSSLIGSLVTPGLLPDEVVPDFYRLIQRDCAAMDDTAVIAHFWEWGATEGRCPSPAALRAGFLHSINPLHSQLEIGPAVRPTLRGENVKYFEIAERAGLIERAQSEGYGYENCPEKIHFVSPTGDLSIVDEKFRYVFSSHCIEHQPDLVQHLKNVEKILENDGEYYIISPDKRYCFDALIPASRFSQVLRAHEERRTVHTYEKVLEHYTMTTHNDGERHWNGDHFNTALVARLEERAENAEKIYAAASGGYIDVHAWQFTPESFRAIVNSLFEQGWIKMKAERVYQTVRGSIEFCAVLKKAA